MNRAVALICGICHPVFSVPNPHAEFVPTFTDKKLSPHGSAWPFAGRLSSCVKVFAFASFAFHNDLHPFIICHRHQTKRASGGMPFGSYPNALCLTYSVVESPHFRALAWILSFSLAVTRTAIRISFPIRIAPFRGIGGGSPQRVKPTYRAASDWDFGTQSPCLLYRETRPTGAVLTTAFRREEQPSFPSGRIFSRSLLGSAFTVK